MSKKTLSIVCRSVMTSEMSEISALQFLTYIRSGIDLMSLVNVEDGAQQKVIKGGSKVLIEKIVEDLKANKVDLVLNTPIRKLSQDDQFVTVESDNSTFKGKYCVVALSPMLCGRLIYNPPLPAVKDELFQRYPMGKVIKIIVSYDRPYWREHGLSGQIVSDDENSPIVSSFDHSHDGYYNLIGFCSGKLAIKYRKLSKEERKKAVCKQYADMFNIEEMNNPIGYFELDWSEELYSRGCYCGNLTPGALINYGNVLKDNFKKIYFTSTELSESWCGYMEGAMNSGIEVAQKILNL